MVEPSPAQPVDLVTEQLLVADLAYGLVITANQAAIEGRQADALRALATVASACTAARPVLRGAILGHRTERQAAQARDLTQRTLAPFFPRVILPARADEQPHAANDEPQAPTPQQPSPSVA